MVYYSDSIFYKLGIYLKSYIFNFDVTKGVKNTALNSD